MKIIQIAAMSQNRVIGVNNALPWNIPEDSKFFRETTKGHCCIFGRKTMESVGHPLPHRLSVVVTRQKEYQPPSTEAKSKAEVAVVSDLEEAIHFCQKKIAQYGDEIYICGGGEIYRQALPVTDRILLTVIHQEYAGDAYFPEIDPKQFKLVERKDRSEPVPFSFLTYERLPR